LRENRFGKNATILRFMVVDWKSVRRLAHHFAPALFLGPSLRPLASRHQQALSEMETDLGPENPAAAQSA